MKRILVSLLLAAAMLLCLAACGAEAAPEAPAPQEAAEALPEDGQNPAMNIIGPYQDRVSMRAVMDVECEGARNGHFLVHWGGSAFESVEWDFLAENEDGGPSWKILEGTRRLVVYSEDGERTETVEAEDLTGYIRVGDDWTITIACDQDPQLDDCVFEFTPPEG